jgi:hypothetical protein
MIRAHFMPGRISKFRPIAGVFSLVVLAAGLLAIGPTSSQAGAAGPPAPLAALSTGNCAWPVQSDPTLVNVAYPDTNATYFVSILPAVIGETLTISGLFPHARYMSLTSYDALTDPVDDLNDQDIVPDTGSINPFLLGSDRSSLNRSFTVHVVFGRRPAVSPANTLYTTSGARQAPAFIILYRIYLPDQGLSSMGGVPLPTVRVNLPGHSSLSLPTCPSATSPALAGLDQTLTNIDLPYPPIPFPGQASLVWHKASAGFIGFFGNPDNAYMTTELGRGYGDVAIIRGQLPTFPNTEGGGSDMGGGQVRYWSLCTNEQVTERVWACLADFQVALSADREYTVVVSTAAARPSNATPRCGLNWLAWGAAPDSFLIMRNMLPSPSFTQSIQEAAVGHEQADLGPYYPVIQYTTTAAVERMGCQH